MAIIEFPLSAGLKANFPERIVVHSMGEYIKGADTHIRHAKEHLMFEGFSAHILVAPNGDLFRCRRDDHGAAHAKGFNVNSLGIEFLVEGTHDYMSFLNKIKGPWVTPEQYDSGLAQILEWCQTWPIKRVDRHSDIDPARKRDPGSGFPWDQMQIAVSEKLLSKL